MGDAYIEAIAGGFRWLLAKEERDRLLDGNGLRLAEWLANGLARVIKQAPHRTIYQVTLPGLSFYLKHYPLTDFRAWFRQLFRPSKARGEFNKALALANRGIATVRPLALGERLTAFNTGESYLITWTLEDAEPLDLFLEKKLSAEGSEARQQLANELGIFMARMHETGVLHRDLHPGNILLRAKVHRRDESCGASFQLGRTGKLETCPTNGRFEFFLIDLHCVRLGDRLAWKTSRANLVQLNRWFALRTSRSDRLRFWKSYFQGRSLQVKRSWCRAIDAVSLRPAKDLERRTQLSNLAFWKARDQRCLRQNRHYAVVRTDAARGFAVADLGQNLVHQLATDPDEPFRRPGIRLLKDSRTSTVAEFEAFLGGRVRRVIYKRFRIKKWTQPWASLLRRSPTLRSWVFGHGLRERRLPTARPLLALHRQRGGLAHEGYLLAEKVENAAELQHYLATLTELPASERQSLTRRRIDQLARLIRDLHDCRLSHRDLKAANLLVVRNPPPALDDSKYGPFCFIDLVGMERMHRLRRGRRVQNLARLNASFLQQPGLTRADRLRFLRVYLCWGLNGKASWKRWWRAIAEATQGKIEKNRRTGRPLA